MSVITLPSNFSGVALIGAAIVAMLLLPKCLLLLSLLFCLVLVE